MGEVDKIMVYWLIECGIGSRGNLISNNLGSHVKRGDRMH